MDDLRIRLAEPGDADALWHILEPVIREGATYPVEPGATREQALAYWLAPDKRVFVAERDGDLAAPIISNPTPPGRPRMWPMPATWWRPPRVARASARR